MRTKPVYQMTTLVQLVCLFPVRFYGPRSSPVAGPSARSSPVAAPPGRSSPVAGPPSVALFKPISPRPPIHPPTLIYRSPFLPQPPESVVRRLFTPPETDSIVIF